MMWNKIAVLIYIPQNAVEINVLNLHTPKSLWKKMQDLEKICTPAFKTYAIAAPLLILRIYVKDG